MFIGCSGSALGLSSTRCTGELRIAEDFWVSGVEDMIVKGVVCFVVLGFKPQPQNPNHFVGLVQTLGFADTFPDCRWSRGFKESRNPTPLNLLRLRFRVSGFIRLVCCAVSRGFGLLGLGLRLLMTGISGGRTRRYLG